MNEAADALEKAEAADKPKKKAAKRKSTVRKTREKAPERKRAVWIVYSGSMKEEGRYTYDQKEAAEARLAALRERSTRKLYFLQLVKELVTEGGVQPIVPIEPDFDEEDDVIKKVVRSTEDGDTDDAPVDDDLADVEVDDADFDDDDGDGDDDGGAEAGDDDE